MTLKKKEKTELPKILLQDNSIRFVAVSKASHTPGIHAKQAYVEIDNNVLMVVAEYSTKDSLGNNCWQRMNFAEAKDKFFLKLLRESDFIKTKIGDGYVEVKNLRKDTGIK